MANGAKRKVDASPEERLQATVSKSLFFYEKGRSPTSPPSDAKWSDYRRDYARRGAALSKIFEKQGLAITAVELQAAE